jgi:hypothetical protein
VCRIVYLALGEGGWALQTTHGRINLNKKGAFALKANCLDTPQLALWSPFLPDLNQLDFSMGCVLEIRVLATPHKNFTTLCDSIFLLWAELDEEYVRNDCYSFRRRRGQDNTAGCNFFDYIYCQHTKQFQ